MFGWTGRIIIIDLDNNSIKESRTKSKIAKDFIGGRGMGVKLLHDLVDPKTDALSPDNPLIFTTGPLTGTEAPMSGIHAITSISPLTGTAFSTSSGGYFGKEMKFTGIDALIIKGKAEKPVYILIQDEDVEIVSAEHLWGKNTTETTDILEAKGRVACIGKAGEHQVVFASFVNDHLYAAGRGGLGAVAGSKNLKAVVVRGTNSPEIADTDAFEEAIEGANKLIQANPATSKGLAEYGTQVFVDLLNYMKILPSNNFRNIYSEDAEPIGAEQLKEKYKLKRIACHSCPVPCTRMLKDKTPVPGYDAIWALGPDIGISDIETIIRANHLCTEYGLDPISCGATIAAYLELTSSKLKTGELEELIEDIGGGKSELGKGSLEYMCSKNSQELSMTSKGLEIPGYDPRQILGQALAYATSNRGGCHLSAYMIAPEVVGKPKLMDRTTLTGKAGLVPVFQNYTAALDSLPLCPFAALALGEGNLMALLSTATGVHYSAEDIMHAGERIWNLERMFNIAAGFTKDDDTLPSRFFGEDGIDRKEFEKAISDYYRFRGWDEDGIPSDKKLKELGLL